jgi:transcriptional regulator of aromatic amino acid metabolism
MARYDFSKEAQDTDKELSDEIKELSGLSDEKIAELLPNRADQDELKNIIEAINRETNVNKKKAVFLNRLAAAAPVVKKAVEGFIKLVVA